MTQNLKVDSTRKQRELKIGIEVYAFRHHVVALAFSIARWNVQWDNDAWEQSVELGIQGSIDEWLSQLEVTRHSYPTILSDEIRPFSSEVQRNLPKNVIAIGLFD